MNYRSVTLLLFFTLISSLASSQWESDQFLFQNSNQKARPKANKRKSLENKNEFVKSEVERNSIDQQNSIDGSSKLNQSSEAKSQVEREIASDQNSSPMKLNLKLGVIDFNSKSQNNEWNFKRESFSFNGDLYFPLKEKNEVSIFYTSTSEIETVDNLKTRLESWGGSLKRAIDVFDNKTELGIVLRQHSWWGTSDNSDFSLKSFNGIGLCGTFDVPNGLWLSKIDFQVTPYMGNEKGSLRGSSLGLSWSGFYQLSFGRAFILSIGNEWIDLRSKTNSTYNLNQNLLKIYIGYQLSNSQ